MLRGLVAGFNTIFPNSRWSISRQWFELLSRIDPGKDMLFMNYGYDEFKSDAILIPLEPEDEKDRYGMQLYHQVAGAVDLDDKDVLEVGCGRGGGAAYIARYLQPKSVVAVDITASAIAFCQGHYQVDNLSFEPGDAQALDFDDEAFDAVVNIESSICYENVDAFFAEVSRVLRPNGYFLYADFRPRSELDMWHMQLNKMGLDLITEQAITPNVLRALGLDSERKKNIINRYIPRLLQTPFNEFAALRGTRFYYGAFFSGEKVYKRFVFRKTKKRKKMKGVSTL